MTHSSSSTSTSASLSKEDTLLFQGAESKVYVTLYHGCPAIRKIRFAKSYRHPLLDRRLRDQRTTREVRNLARCRQTYRIRAPVVLSVDKKNCEIVMEYIQGGKTIKDCLDEEQAKLPPCTTPPEERGLTLQSARLLIALGYTVGRLHAAGIVHGDLTTSNFMYCLKDDVPTTTTSQDGSDNDGVEVVHVRLPDAVRAALSSSSCEEISFHPAAVVVLDFGLVPEKHNEEERAVDLYVLERALLSTHPFLMVHGTALVMVGYAKGAMIAKPNSSSPSNHNNKNKNTNSKEEKEMAKRLQATLDRLEVVRARGRKRSMVG